MLDITKSEIGTKVKIVNEFDYSDPMGINDGMEEMKGKYATIVYMGRNGNGNYVELDIDGGRFYWTSSMLEIAALNKGRQGVDTTVDIVKEPYESVYNELSKYLSSILKQGYLCSWENASVPMRRS